MKQKDAKNEVKFDVLNYFNAFDVFKCGRNILDRNNVSYERLGMATPKEEYFGDMLHQLIEHNHRHGTPIFNEKLQEAVISFKGEKDKRCLT